MVSWYEKLDSQYSVLLIDSLSSGKPYSGLMRWMQTRLSVCVLKLKKCCMRGSRVKWRSDVGMEDGVGLAVVVNQLSNFILYHCFDHKVTFISILYKVTIILY